MKHSPIKNIVGSKKFKATSLALAVSTILLTTANAQLIYDGEKENSSKLIKDNPSGYGQMGKWTLPKTLYGEGSDNKVIVRNIGDNAFNMVGGLSKTIANGNELEINGDILKDTKLFDLRYFIAGGYADSDKSEAANNNKIVINGNIYHNARIFGGNVAAFDTGTPEKTSASYNEVFIAGNALADEIEIHGGIASNHKDGSAAEANYNEVKISGSTNASRITGGSAITAADFNTVEIGGDFYVSGKVAGG